MCPREQRQDGREVLLAKPSPLEEKKPRNARVYGVILVGDWMCWRCLGPVQACSASFPAPSV